MEQSDWSSQDGEVRLEKPGWSRVDYRARSPFYDYDYKNIVQGYS